MLTKAMAAEWGEHGIQANAIGPGYMLTDMNEALTSNPDFDAWVKAEHPPVVGESLKNLQVQPFTLALLLQTMLMGKSFMLTVA
ncbi:hypothetical protein HORIV_25280 [Vreelandella olivaria]|uniref:Uncharacterized protein n=1 Tax=Vreelandella olivaria TaxID=390919 RepID=A0ABN5WW20_9GAMM|nr:hypothetical protein HORIV_25280 [Halomonas olivaria]